MTIEQRKLELISWITSLQTESVIDQLEAMQQTAGQENSEEPPEIIELLHLSNATPKSEAIEHTSVRDLLKS